ncbi:M48 family metallopeptidase [Myxococcus landrumensis]|uniref:M48 family metallopeptidase n=1 Tax=Myxococcus landrumensis TaxID=2813577 RepID=A0ABX7MYI2_9BACT|nr:M48 family metallopeptidase [Myxococcus landrumus]QSQ11346.1 M48 family metallopeptidase [Myxococcus landrumus]
MKTLWKALAFAGLGVLSVSCKGMTMDQVARGVGQVVDNSAAAQKQRDECRKLDVEPTVQEEYAIGSAMAVHWVQSGGGLWSEGSRGTGVHSVHEYLNTVGKNLGAQSARPTLEWTFGVLNDDKNFNAVSTPGAYVFVTRKLLSELENESQLAGVLAHEIAHIVLKHSIKQYNSAKVSLCQVAVTMEKNFPGSGQLIAAGGSGGNLDLDSDSALLGNLTEKVIGLAESGNDREQEYAADKMAVRMMISAGYDPNEYRALLRKTEDGSSIGSRHPKKEDREKRIVAFLDGLKAREGEFTELSLEGLRSPPLKPELVAAVKGSGRSGVAKDSK